MTQLVFGPSSPFPVAFRVSGPDVDKLRVIAERVRTVMADDPMMRTVNTDWGERVPTLHFALDQARLRAMGLTSSDVAEQLQFLLSGVHGVAGPRGHPHRRCGRAFRRTGAARSRARGRLHPDRGERRARARQPEVGRLEVRMEDPILLRRDRVPTITVRGDIADGLQPPDVSTAMFDKLQPVIASLPPGYAIAMGGSIEEAAKANSALAPIFPIMILLMMIVIILQVRSFSAMAIVLLTAPLGLIGVVPTLLLTGQSFGFNAILGLIALAGILMRNTLILIGQIQDNERQGLKRLRRGDRGDGAAIPAGHPDRAGRGARLHPADDLGLLGSHGFHADRRNARRNDSDPRLPARALHALVPAPARRTGPGARSGAGRCLERHAPWPPLEFRVMGLPLKNGSQTFPHPMAARGEQRPIANGGDAILRGGFAGFRTRANVGEYWLWRRRRDSNPR